MAVRQLTETCWWASWDGDKRTGKEAGYSGHWSKPDCESLTGWRWIHVGCGGLVADGYCLACETADLGAFDEPRTIELRRLVARPLTGCWEVACDECGLELEDDDSGTVHVGSSEAAARAAIAYGWSVFEDGRAFCGGHEPPPGSGVLLTLPDPDQPVLFAAGEAQ